MCSFEANIHITYTYKLTSDQQLSGTQSNKRCLLKAVFYHWHCLELSVFSQFYVYLLILHREFIPCCLHLPRTAPTAPSWHTNMEVFLRGLLLGDEGRGRRSSEGPEEEALWLVLQGDQVASRWDRCRRALQGVQCVPSLEAGQSLASWAHLT